MSSGILAPSLKRRCGHPAGHPKLMQLETPLYQNRVRAGAEEHITVIGLPGTQI